MTLATISSSCSLCFDVVTVWYDMRDRDFIAERQFHRMTSTKC